MKNFTHSIVVSFILTIVALSAASSQNSWKQRSIPSVNSPVTALAINDTGVIFAGTQGSGFYLSSDTGNTWKRIDTGTAVSIQTTPPETTLVPLQHYFYSVSIDARGDVWAGSYYGVVYHFTNNGAGWSLSVVGSGRSIVTSFVFDKSGNVYAGTGGEGLFVSSNQGQNWSPLNLTDLNEYIMSAVIDTAGVIFVGTYGDGVYSSNNQGHSWSRSGTEFLRVNCLAVAKADGRIFAGTDEGVFCDSLRIDTVTLKPVRAGWVRDTVGMLPRPYVSPDVISLVIAGGHVFAGTAGNVSYRPGVYQWWQSGVYQSSDNGLSWQRMNVGLADTVVSALAVNDSGYLFAGTRKGGVYSTVQPVFARQPRALPFLPAPVVVALEQNYPNPFNPTTVIPFTLSHTSSVSLVIYDDLGREVARLIDGVVPAGRHEAQWNASNMPSGVYFYRFQSPSTIQTGKLILMK